LCYKYLHGYNNDVTANILRAQTKSGFGVKRAFGISRFAVDENGLNLSWCANMTSESITFLVITYMSRAPPELQGQIAPDIIKQYIRTRSRDMHEQGTSALFSL
jgi:hypothetical protein